MSSSIRYTVVLAYPDAHQFEVHCTVDDPDPRGQAFRLPTWIPGSYLIREFARNIVQARAECNGQPVPIRKTTKDTWTCAPCSGALTVVAEIYAWDLSVRGAHFDRTHAFFNGTSLFLSPVGMEQRACTVDLVAPSSSVENEFLDWRVATSLPRDGAAPYGFGRYRASDYDELIDHPVEMGTFTLASFEAGGAQHDIAITGRHDCDMNRLTRDLKRICTTQIDFFGGAANSRAPMDHYVFLVMALGDAYGGLEHRASTSLVIGRDKLPRAGLLEGEVSDEYIEFLGLVSHEYFHTWNVKRIKPAAFVPYDLTREAYTRQLWVFEGFTSYYDNLMLVRSGLISLDQYLALIGQDVTKVLRGSGRKKQSVAESSFDAWIKYYRQDENSPNALVSYYVKGSLVAMLLDLHLRTKSKTSLDDVMRELWRRYGMTATGVPENGVLEVSESLSGLDLDDFFASYIDGTEEIPLTDALMSAGIALHLRPSEGNKDTGGKCGKRSKSTAKGAKATAGKTLGRHGESAAADASTDGAATDTQEAIADPPTLWLGARWTASGEARLTHVFDEGPAQSAGLAAGDTVIAWDGLKVSANLLQARISRMAPGAQATVHAFRRDELMTFLVGPKPAPMDTCWLALSPESNEEAVALRTAWLLPGCTS